MKRFVINQDSDRGVYIQDQVEQVEHSTASQLIGLSLCDMYWAIISSFVIRLYFNIIQLQQ